MALDPLSPVAPARIRTLLLPVGRIKRSRFKSFLERLQPVCNVRLGDVSPDSRPDRTMFSPLAYPNGYLIYEFTTSVPLQSHASLSPFELHREPLAILGIADWSEKTLTPNGPAQTDKERLNAFSHALETFREGYPRALAHRILAFDVDDEKTSTVSWPEGVAPAPLLSQSSMAAMRTIMCNISSQLLAEMTTYAKSLQALSTIESPSAPAVPSSGFHPSHSSVPSLSRHNSQVTRSGSPAIENGLAHSQNHRMSMPVLPSSRSLPGSSTTSRTASPLPEGRMTPATTFDDIPGVANNASITRSDSVARRPLAVESLRDASQERVSVQGFGSGSVNERARTKGKGRVSIVIGSLYLSAGRWNDAMRELEDGTSKAKALSDHLWHARGLESMLVCLLLQSWIGINFKIPSVCYPAVEKSSATGTPQHTPSHSLSSIKEAGKDGDTKGSLSNLQQLVELLPDLANMILTIYGRSVNFGGEALPQVAHSECIIRLCKLLTLSSLLGSHLSEEALRHIVLGKQFAIPPGPSGVGLATSPYRSEVADMLLRALPSSPPSPNVPVSDHINILAAVASVLSSLGLHRKKALVLKELIAAIIPGLVQARKIGAAEMGVHPAAGLAALTTAASGVTTASGGAEARMNVLLFALGRVYGIPELILGPSKRDKSTESNSKFDAGPSNSDDTQSGPDSSIDRLTLRRFGSMYLKLDVLRDCLNLAEALPDFAGAMLSSASILSIARSDRVLTVGAQLPFVSLSREEQVRLASNISRTVAAAQKVGLGNVLTDYWDEFLIRDIRPLDPPPAQAPVLHSNTEFRQNKTGTDTVKKNPFIFSALAKQSEKAASTNLLVATEQAEFLAIVQNPFDTELEIEAISLASEGSAFEPIVQRINVGPHRTQNIVLSGRPLTAGELKITGCVVKIRGCHEKSFSIFDQNWKPARAVKVKDIGLSAMNSNVERPVSAISTGSQGKQLPETSSPQSKLPIPSTIQLNVLRPQPLIAISDIGLPQKAITLLEGERRKFRITLDNQSEETLTDFLHVSFQDSTMAPLQAALTKKDLPRLELHELEVQLIENPALRWLRKEDEDVGIKPKGSATVDIEIVGKPGLTEALVQIDYASTGAARADLPKEFYTRQVFLPLTITVNASIQLHRMDMSPFRGDHASLNKSEHIMQHSANNSLQPTSISAPNQDTNDIHCLMLLDLRNSWPSPLTISLSVDNNITTALFQPGHIIRLPLLIPALSPGQPHAPIPTLNPANRRQFIVSASKVSPDIERANREAFWYREELLKVVRGSWKDEESGRGGSINLRAIRLLGRHVEVLKRPEVEVDWSITTDNQDSERVEKLGKSRFKVQTEEFFTAKATVTNKSSSAVLAVLRLQPSLAKQASSYTLDLGKRLVWSGLLQQKLPKLSPGESADVSLNMCALCTGDFDLGATVEEVVPGDVRDQADGAEVELDDLVADKRRRVWYAREHCTIVAVD